MNLSVVRSVWLLCCIGLFGLRSRCVGNRVVLDLRGGLVPQAKETGGDYYEQFHLDYGTRDRKRIAGALRGFITSGKLSSLPESDPFFKWLNAHLEKGPESVSGRVKPFYAADFGEKRDLQQGENPKVYIVQRRLVYDERGVLQPPSSNEVDVEEREIWQPWLKRRCNFVARYIVPNRVNILQIMGSQGRFVSELEVDDDGSGKRAAWAKMTFKPTLAQRLSGRRSIVVRRALEASKLGLSTSSSSLSTINPPTSSGDSSPVRRIPGLAGLLERLPKLRSEK